MHVSWVLNDERSEGEGRRRDARRTAAEGLSRIFGIE